MASLLKHLKKLSMRTQVIIIQSIITILILFILTITYLSLYFRIIYLMEESSSKALIRINNGQINQVSVALKNMLDDQFQDIYRNLNKSQKLFLNSEQMIKHDFTYCDVYSPTISLVINYSQLFHCVFLAKEYKLQTQDQYLKIQKFISLYDSMLLAMWKQEIQQASIMSGLQDPKLFASYPKSYFTDQFRIEDRPYFIQQMNQEYDINIADPFYYYGSTKVILIVTRLLKDENQINQMLIGFGISLDLLDNFIKLKNSKLLICTLSGMILASNLLDTLTLSTLNKQTYIYNQTYFDFDTSDWEQMKKYLDKNAFLSDCTKDYNYFCRKINGSDVQIHVTVIQGKFLLIIFNDLSFVKSYQDNINSIIDELFITIISQTSIFCSISLAIIIISFGMLTLLLRPVAQIITIIEQQIRTQIQEIDKVQQNQIVKKDIFDILKESYMNFLMNFRESRYNYGQQLNQFKYPKMPLLKTDFQDIQNIQNRFNNENQSPLFRKRNSRSFHSQGQEDFEQNSNLLNLIKTLTQN